MSCFFCDSFSHLSQNCDRFFSDKCRRNIANLKNCCSNCFHRVEEFPCKYCKLYKKCHICFLSSHHTYLCRHRKNVSPFFIPDINEDLLPRFIQFLNLEEQYSLAFTSPLALKAVKLKRLCPIYRSDRFIMENTKNLIFVITDSYDYSFDHPIRQKGSSSSLPYSPFNSIIFKCKQISISGGEVTSQEFMQLFSVHLISGYFGKIKLLSTVTLANVIKAAPNMEFINFSETNVTIERSWPDDILTLKNGNTLELLKFPIEEFNFDMKKLVAVLEVRARGYLEKSKPSVKISFDITNMFPNIINATENHQLMVKKLVKIMSPTFKLRSIRNSSSYYRDDININFTTLQDNSFLIKKSIALLLRYLSVTSYSIIRRTTPPSTRKVKGIFLNIKR